MTRMFDPGTAFLQLEDQVWSPLATREARAAAFVRSAARARARPAQAETRYRFPRGRQTDVIPQSGAFIDPLA